MESIPQQLSSVEILALQRATGLTVPTEEKKEQFVAQVGEAPVIEEQRVRPITAGDQAVFAHALDEDQGMVLPEARIKEREAEQNGVKNNPDTVDDPSVPIEGEVVGQVDEPGGVGGGADREKKGDEVVDAEVSDIGVGEANQADPTREERETRPRTEREDVNDYIKRNEVALNKLLLQEGNIRIESLDQSDMLIKMVKMSKSIHKDALLARFAANDRRVYQEMLPVAQDLYIKTILGEKDFVQLVSNSYNIKSGEATSGEIDVVLRGRFAGKIAGLVARVFTSDTRRWFEYGPDGEIMKANLDRFLINKFNRSEIVEEQSDLGAVVRILKSAYLQSDEIRGTQELKISKEPNAELLRQMIKIHDVTVMMDNPTFKPDPPRAELLQSVDEALIAMLSLKKRDTLIVPKVMETYDTVMRELYGANGREIDIDSQPIKDEVTTRLRGYFESDEEMKMFVKMGRDVCRMTGVDAQYGYPTRVVANDKSGLALTVKGAFLRGLLNYNTALISYGVDTRLTGGINLGMVPFWNKIRKIDGVKSAPITEEMIGNLIRDKMTGSENFLGWFGTLKGYTEAKKAEGEFIAMPTLVNFMEKAIPAYWGYLQYTPDVAKDYFLRRFNSCIPFFIASGEGRDRLKTSVINIFLKDGNFDGKGIFSSPNELKKFFTDRGVNINVHQANLNIDREKIMNRPGFF